MPPPPAAALPPIDGSRAAVLDGIKGAGGIRALKKVDRSLVRDRSAAAVPGADTGPAGSGLPPAGVTPGGGGGMADALALALQKRKEKVSKSGKFFVTRDMYVACVIMRLTCVEQMMKMMAMIGTKCLISAMIGERPMDSS